jgi:hypothetical protein
LRAPSAPEGNRSPEAADHFTRSVSWNEDGENEVKTFETYQRMIAGELTRKGYKATMRKEGLRTLYVFEVEDEFVTPRQHDLRRRYHQKRLHTAKQRPAVTRQNLIAKGLVKPARAYEVVMPQPVVAPLPTITPPTTREVDHPLPRPTCLGSTLLFVSYTIASAVNLEGEQWET